MAVHRKGAKLGVGHDQFRDDPATLGQFWQAEIKNAQEQQEMYFQDVRRARRVYRNKAGTIASVASGGRMPSATERTAFSDNPALNVFYTNIETIRPLVFSQGPTPLVKERIDRGDPNERAVAEIMQKVLSIIIDSGDFDIEEVIPRVITDYLIDGRGMADVDYVQYGKPVPTDPIKVRMDPNSKKWVSPDGSIIPDSVVEDKSGGEGLWVPTSDDVSVRESVVFRYMDHMDVLVQPAKRWDLVRWVAVRMQLTRSEAVGLWGEAVASRISFDEQEVKSASRDGKSSSEDVPMRSEWRRANFFKIYDKRNRRIVWLQDTGDASPDNLERDGIVKIEEEDLGIADFFPFPAPLQTGNTNDTVEPVPDFVHYEASFWMLQRLHLRFMTTMNAVQVLGFFMGEDQEVVEKAFSSDGRPKLIPLTEGDNKKASDLVAFLDIKAVAEAAKSLYEGGIEAHKKFVDEISGVSDIMRGRAQARETATASRQKIEFGGARISEKKRAAGRFIRDLIRKAAEVVAARFKWETIEYMSGVKLRPKAEIEKEIEAAQAAMEGGDRSQMAKLQMLQNEPDADTVEEIIREDLRRNFAIEIETDSTVVADQEFERRTRVELMNMLGQASQSIQPLVVMGVLPREMMGSLFAMFIRGMPMSRELVTKLESHVPPQPEPPPPPDSQVKAESDAKMKEMELKAQAEEADKKRAHELQMLEIKNAAELQRAEIQALGHAQDAQLQAGVKAGADELTAQTKQSDIAARLQEGRESRQVQREQLHSQEAQTHEKVEAQREAAAKQAEAAKATAAAKPAAKPSGGKK